VGKATQVMAAGRRCAVWLLPAGRRDWAAAVWAEAHEVPPGLARLSWRAGGAWVLAREALLLRRLGRAVLFAAAACVAVWATWPRPWVGHVAEGRFNAIAPVLLVAGLPLLSRRLFGPVSPGRLARSLRVLCCAAVLALVAASTVLLVFSMLAPTKPAYLRIFCGGQGCAGVVPGRSSGGPTWQGEILVMLLVIGYVGVTLFLTSRRSQVTRSTLAIGVGTGLLFGVVMFAVDPLGLSNYATNPWLPGSTADPLVALAWFLLFGGPAAAAVLAGRRCRGPDGARPPYDVRVGQGIAAGVLANGLAAMFTSLLGTGTTLLMLKYPWLLHWFTHSRPLTAMATYRYELHTVNAAGAYGLMLMSFPVIGLFMGSLAAVIVNPAPSSSGSPGNGGGPPGPGPGPGPELEPEPPGGGRAKSDRVPVPVLSGCTVFCPPHVRSPRSGLPTTHGE
jgi:hypothetical protein